MKAFCMKQQDFRIFKLNRILELELSENTFIPRPYPEQSNDLQKKLHIVLMMNLMKHRLNINKMGISLFLPICLWMHGLPGICSPSVRMWKFWNLYI